MKTLCNEFNTKKLNYVALTKLKVFYLSLKVREEQIKTQLLKPYEKQLKLFNCGIKLCFHNKKLDFIGPNYQVQSKFN